MKKVNLRFALLVLVSLALFGGWTGEAVAQEGEGEEVRQTGTDPRDIAGKFMPYYLHTELSNGLYQNAFTLFGLMPLGGGWALTYELPLAFERNITDTEACAGLPATPCFGTIPGGGVTLPNGLAAEGDGKETGIGDGNIRLFRGVGSAMGGDWMLGFEFDLPIATDPVMGSETAILAPMFVFVKNLAFWPAPGAFVASMNFYAFDVWRDAGRDAVSQYRGRWFVMLPLHPSGIYTLPEVQPVYDFETDHFSLWIAPEVGKMLGPGRILYLKPGFGIFPDSDSGDREWTFEVGYRWFLN